MIIIQLQRKNQKGEYYPAWRKTLQSNEMIEVLDTEKSYTLFKKYGVE